MKTEINLMSPQANADRMRLVFNRRINAIGDAILVCLLLIACSYGAVFWVLSEMSVALYARTEGTKEESVRMEQELRDISDIFKASDAQIKNSPLWTPLISDVVRAVPSGISIIKLQLSQTPRTLSLTGKATQGSAIVQYQRALEELSWVDHVVAPLQNFAVSPNATVTFTIFRKDLPAGRQAGPL